MLDGTLVGTQIQQPFLTDVVPNVRFLIAIPILLLADIPIDAATRTAIHYLEVSGVIPDDEKPRYHATLDSMKRARDATLPDVVIIVLAYAFTWMFNPGYGDSAIATIPMSWQWSVQDGETNISAAGWWFLLVSAPMFQVILGRWLWRFLIWIFFLFRLSRLRLALRPVHPDLAGGLGFVGTCQQSFVIVFFAFATVLSSTIAHDLLSEGEKFLDARLEIAVLVVLLTLIVYLPLLLFSSKLYEARRDALADYGVLGYRLSGAFKQKWVREDDAGVGAELQASTDSSAIADYAAAFDNVRSTRLMPVPPRGILVSAGVLLIPFLPLVFTEFSLQDLFNRVVDSLV